MAANRLIRDHDHPGNGNIPVALSPSQTNSSDGRSSIDGDVLAMPGLAARAFCQSAATD
jgi:hypothetical protein